MDAATVNRDKIDIDLDDLLARWHRYTEGYRFSKGYSNVSSTTRNFQIPTHWDWANGAVDEREEKIIMRGVSEAIERVPNDPRPWKTMIQFEARNLAVGASVWHSPRLPTDKGEFEILRLEARNKTLKELYRQGVMT